MTRTEALLTALNLNIVRLASIMRAHMASPTKLSDIDKTIDEMIRELKDVRNNVDE